MLGSIAGCVLDAGLKARHGCIFFRFLVMSLAHPRYMAMGETLCASLRWVLGLGERWSWLHLLFFLEVSSPH